MNISQTSIYSYCPTLFQKPTPQTKNPFCARLKEPIFYQKKNILYWQPLFEHEEEDNYKPVRLGNFWSSTYVEYENNSDRNKTLSIEDYLNKSRPYLKDRGGIKKTILFHEKMK